MRTFKFFWTTHKWAGIGLSAVIMMSAVTGFLLLLKKKVDWIQPPTVAGAPGGVSEFLTVEDALAAAARAGGWRFATLDDIDRIDMRPDKRVYKVRSVHDDMEVQVDAITGEALSVATRRSDLLERIHDGSFIAEWFHDWAMPAAAVVLLFMVFSGFWLWLEPKWWRRRRRRRLVQQN